MIATLQDVVEAIENKQLVPTFQPLVEIRSGVLFGFEVLARWNHPVHGLILPSNLITLAENNGLIDLLMDQIFVKAFQIAQSLDMTQTLSVNLSPVQLQNRALPDHIARMADQAGYSLQQLIVEITETALLSDIDCARAIALDLKSLGCRLALDDFGTGYSSLSHLQALPFDELKIDRSFVTSMVSKRESRKIVAAVIGLGHSLGLKTVAEGIETEEHADMLLWLGCEVGQGWLYGKPIPAAELAGAIAAPPRPTITALSSPGDGWAVSSLEALPTQRLAQLQAIYEGAPVGLCFLDRNLRYVSLNGRLADMNSAPVAAHLGRTVKEVIPHIYEKAEPFLLRALAGEAIAKVEIQTPPAAPGDTGRSLLLSYQPAWDEADEVIGVSVSVIDVTEYQTPARTEDAAAHTRPPRHTPWIMDAEGNNLASSASWVQKMDPGGEATRNLGWLEALHPDDLAPVIKTMRECLRSGAFIDIQYRVRDLNGDWQWMRSTGVPRFAPNGEILRWYGSVEEIDGPISEMEIVAGNSTSAEIAQTATR